MLIVISGETDFELAQHQIGAAEVQLFHEIFPDSPHLFLYLPELSMIRVFPEST